MSREATRREAAGHRVLHLEVGQPSTGAPWAAIAAVTAALDRPLGYTNADGLASLRHRIARSYAERHDVTVDPDRIVAVAGASAGFTLAFLASFESGARVGVVEPGYPCYRNSLLALDMVPVPIAVGPDTRWAPTPEVLDAAGPLDGLVVASPSNPTGTVLDASTLAVLTRHCSERGIRLISDEIYHGITYGDPAPTILAGTGPSGADLSGAGTAVVVNSFSKYYSMTGWRIGWMVVPDDLVDAVARLQQNLYICAAHVSQVAATAAMDATDELDAHVARYAANRATLLDGLAAAGIDRVADADGAFYVYADVAHLIHDSREQRAGGRSGAAGGRSNIPADTIPADTIPANTIAANTMELCERWLDEIGVACTPGIDFDLARGGRFVRFSYAGATEHIAQACDLIAGWTAKAR